jgi:hypothetical protein
MITQMRRLVPALVAGLTACSGPSAVTPATDVPSGATNVEWNDASTVHLAHAYNSGFRQPVRTIVDNDADWRATWSTFTANLGSPPPLPEVDFAREQVIVTALGERNSGGYDISISRNAATSDDLSVEVTSTRPGPRCGVTAALTQPVDMVRIPRQHPPVMFTEKSAQHDC